MLIFEYIYIFGVKIPTITFFVVFGALFWFFVTWRESHKDGFLHSKLFDLSFLLFFISGLIYFGLQKYYNWFSLYKPDNWLLHYNKHIVFSLVTFLIAYILTKVFSKRNRWSVYRILDILSTSLNFFLFSFFLGFYLIYGGTESLLVSVLVLTFYVFLLRLRGYSFKSGYLFSLYVIFLCLLVFTFYKVPGYLLFCLVLSTIGVLNFTFRRRVIMDKKPISQELIDGIKDKLKAKDAKLVQEELQLKRDDPYFQEGRAEGNGDEIDEAVLEDQAKELLENKLTIISQVRMQIGKALSLIKLGKYGKCEKCGAHIDKARLKAYPEATTCLKCASHASK